MPQESATGQFEAVARLDVAPLDWRVAGGEVYAFLEMRLVRLPNVVWHEWHCVAVGLQGGQPALLPAGPRAKLRRDKVPSRPAHVGTVKGPAQRDWTLARCRSMAT